jgi:hypothetical protein
MGVVECTLYRVRWSDVLVNKLIKGSLHQDADSSVFLEKKPLSSHAKK